MTTLGPLFIESLGPNHHLIKDSPTSRAGMAVVWDKAHADLFAASPDLVRVLAQLVDAFDADCDWSDRDAFDADCDWSDRDWREAREILAKARGGK